MKITFNNKTYEIKDVNDLIAFYQLHPNETSKIIKEMSTADFLNVIDFSSEFQTAINKMPKCADTLVQKALNDDEVFVMVTLTHHMVSNLTQDIPAEYANQLLDKLATDDKHFDRLYYQNGDVYDLMGILGELSDPIADKYLQRIFTDQKIYDLVYENIMPFIQAAHGLSEHVGNQLLEKILDNEKEFLRLIDDDKYTLMLLAGHFPQYACLDKEVDEVIPAWKAEKAKRAAAEANVAVSDAAPNSYAKLNLFADINKSNKHPLNKTIEAEVHDLAEQATVHNTIAAKMN